MDSRVLLVHGDPGILRGLEAGLRSEGFEVQTAQTGVEGLKIFQTSRPSLIMTEVAVGELDGFAFVTRLRQDPIGKTAAVLLADPGKGPGRRLRAIQAGADSRLTGVDPTRELMTRARLLFGSPKREAAGGTATAPRGFACDLADLDVLDLVALVQRNGRSGVATLTAPGRVPGSLFFDQGRLIDAQAGHASGMEAFHRLASWTAGALNLEWRNFRRRDVLARTPTDLVMSGLAHLQEWTQLLGRLATPNTVFRVDLDALIDRLSSSGGQLTEVLNACDGVRSVVQIVDECSSGALDVLRSLLQLCEDGVISDPGQPARTERPDRPRPDASESTLMGGGAGMARQLPVSPPLVPPAPAAGASAPRRDSPATGARLTAPLGQAGLPVSSPESKKLPAVTMQFPAGLPFPGRTAAPQAPGMPPAVAAPVARAPQPNEASSPEPKTAQPESPSARTTMSRALPPRIQPNASPAPAPIQAISGPATRKPLEQPAPVQTADKDSGPAPAPLVLAQPPASQAALTISRPQAVVRVGPAGDVPGEPPSTVHHLVPPTPAHRRPWWERRNEKRPPPNADPVSKWDPVWPQAALPPSEPSNALARVDRDPAGGESPTVFLPAHLSDAGAIPGRPAPARAAVVRAGAARRQPNYSEGIRPRPDRKQRGLGSRKSVSWWQRHRSALLVIAASVLLVSLVAIGVALVRSIGR